jgi:hypothetical protein
MQSAITLFFELDDVEAGGDFLVLERRRALEQRSVQTHAGTFGIGEETDVCGAMILNGRRARGTCRVAGESRGGEQDQNAVGDAER